MNLTANHIKVLFWLYGNSQGYMDIDGSYETDVANYRAIRRDLARNGYVEKTELSEPLWGGTRYWKWGISVKGLVALEEAGAFPLELTA